MEGKSKTQKRLIPTPWEIPKKVFTRENYAKAIPPSEREDS
jgi:hypothetical protein